MKSILKIGLFLNNIKIGGLNSCYKEATRKIMNLMIVSVKVREVKIKLTPIHRIASFSAVFNEICFSTFDV